MNRLLPPAIRVLETAEASPDFHPRFDARSKTYEYRIFRGEVCSPFERHFVLHHPYPLNTAAMARTAPLFLGEHDFSAFAASDERDALGHSKVRSVTSSEILSEGDRLVYRIAGSGFLKHMVRHIVGTLMEVGKGNLDDERVRHLLTAHQRQKAIHAVPARGLFLVRVEY
jgi:tRNA pseudouridine38-40 synthase